MELVYSFVSVLDDMELVNNRLSVLKARFYACFKAKRHIASG